MSLINLLWDTDGTAITNVTLNDKPLAEASPAELADAVVALIGHSAAIQKRYRSPGLERRAWAEKTPEDRKPGASLIDRGGVR